MCNSNNLNKIKIKNTKIQNKEIQNKEIQNKEIQNKEITIILKKWNPNTNHFLKKQR